MHIKQKASTPDVEGPSPSSKALLPLLLAHKQHEHDILPITTIPPSISSPITTIHPSSHFYPNKPYFHLSSYFNHHYFFHKSRDYHFRDESMPPRNSDEKKCLIPPERTMNAAQYASYPRRRPSGGHDAPSNRQASGSDSNTPMNSSSPPTGTSTMGEASTNPNTNINPLLSLSPLSPESSTTHPTTSEDQPATLKASEKRSISQTDVFPSAVPKELWKIFLTKVAPTLPDLAMDTGKLSTTLAQGINHGQVGYDTIDPTLGICLAIGSLVSRDPQVWHSRKWYEKARGKLEVVWKNKRSIEYFQARFLQITYLQMSGELDDAWDILHLSIAQAGFDGIRISSNGQLILGSDFGIHARVISQIICMIKPSLAFQLGYTHHHAGYDFRLPTRSWIEKQLEQLVPNKNRREAKSAFFFASASIATFTEALMKLNTDLRLTRSDCPMPWVSTMDMNELLELDDSMHKWYHSLPKSLEWKGLGIGSLLETDVVVRRMRVLTRLGYLYLHLRLGRSFLILNLRLLCICCESMPHMDRHALNEFDRPQVFEIIRGRAIRCVEAAQSIIKTLWKPSGNGKDDNLGDITSSEKVDMIYSAALVLIAGRMVPYIVEQRDRAPNLARSVSTLIEQIRQADVMLRNCQENCNQSPDFGQRIQRSRAFLDLVRQQSISSGDIPYLVTDGMLTIGRPVWANLYARLRVNVRFEDQVPADQVSGKRLLFSWVESLPIDFEG